MERKDCLKMGDSFPSSSSSSLLDYYPVMSNSTLTGLFDFCGEGEKNGSLGFMELLNMPQDFSSSSSVFDFDASQTVEPFMTSKRQVQESSEVLNAPATPNYSSISSESSGGQNDIEHSTKDEDDEEEEEEHQKTNKHLKPKKTSGQKKKEREPRFAFMTKSEVDHLEDGFRWRKYGQKAVKNSPFPRSYYRCTTASCNVKKRVERSSNDPSTVVTTYEGQHTHPSPGMPRSGPAATTLPPYSGGGGSFSAPRQMLLSPHDQTHFDFSIPLSCGYNMGNYTNHVMNSAAGAPQHLRFRNPTSSALLTDYGLLQDIVPSSIIKKEE